MTKWVACYFAIMFIKTKAVVPKFFLTSVFFNSKHAGPSVIRELVHSFLLELCCSQKHGINFHDASFGTVGRWVILTVSSFICVFAESSCWSWDLIFLQRGKHSLASVPGGAETSPRGRVGGRAGGERAQSYSRHPGQILPGDPVFVHTPCQECLAGQCEIS